MVAVLTVYMRQGCHLCEDMITELQVMQADHGFDLRAVDIDGDAALVARYGPRVPVLCAGDSELSCYFLDKKSLEDFLQQD